MFAKRQGPGGVKSGTTSSTGKTGATGRSFVCGRAWAAGVGRAKSLCRPEEGHRDDQMVRLTIELMTIIQTLWAEGGAGNRSPYSFGWRARKSI